MKYLNRSLLKEPSPYFEISGFKKVSLFSHFYCPFREERNSVRIVPMHVF